MLRNIMVPLDGSIFAEQALPMALSLARTAGARLHLVSVRASLQLDMAPPVAELYLAGLEERLAPQLPGRIVRHVLMNELGPLEYPLARGTVAEVVVRHAIEEDIDLIVMTTHGRSGIARAWIGSVADSIVRSAPRPVLLIRPADDHFGSALDADRGIRHIVVPLDGSQRAERVFEYAQELGEAFDARYTLVRVLVPVFVSPAPEWSATSALVPLPAEARTEAWRYLEDVAGRMRAVGMSVATQVVDSMKPAAAIVDQARLHDADMIAMSTAGAGGVRRLLLGSVADSVVRTSTVPVLVCNADAPARATAITSRDGRALAGVG